MVKAIFEWRQMKHAHELSQKDGGMDQLMASPTLFHWMQVVDMGEEEALEMLREAQQRSRDDQG